MTTKKAPAMKTKTKKQPTIVLVRSPMAGVIVGELMRKSRDGKTVELRNSRKVWRWRGANTVEDLARDGAAEEWTRISGPALADTITDAAQCLTCTPEAAANLQRSRWGA